MFFAKICMFYKEIYKLLDYPTRAVDNTLAVVDQDYHAYKHFIDASVNVFITGCTDCTVTEKQFTALTPDILQKCIYKMVQVGKDQEKAQSERNSHRGGKKQIVNSRYLYL